MIFISKLQYLCFDFNCIHFIRGGFYLNCLLSTSLILHLFLLYKFMQEYMTFWNIIDNVFYLFVFFDVLLYTDLSFSHVRQCTVEYQCLPGIYCSLNVL